MKTQVRNIPWAREDITEKDSLNPIIKIIIFWLSTSMIAVFIFSTGLNNLTKISIIPISLILLFYFLYTSSLRKKYTLYKGKLIKTPAPNILHHQHFLKNTQTHKYISDHIFWGLQAKIRLKLFIEIVKFSSTAIIFIVFAWIHIVPKTIINTNIFLIAIFCSIWCIISIQRFIYKRQCKKVVRKYSITLLSFRKKEYFIDSYINLQWEEHYFIR